MAADQIGLFGAPAPVTAPRVPAVTFHAAMVRQQLPKARRPWCDHCLMVRHAAERGVRKDVDLDIFTPLRAIVVITQVDGSTLTLCEQHAEEHRERGDQDG